MKVREAITLLSQYDPEKEIFVSVQLGKGFRQHQEVLGIGGGENTLDVCILTGFTEKPTW